MCGTRDAAQNWENTYREAHEEFGVQSGKSIAMCHASSRKRGVRLVVHGDAFTALGQQEGLDWHRKVLTQRFEAKVKGRFGTREDGREVDKGY